jgi:hypothetical protein
LNARRSKSCANRDVDEIQFTKLVKRDAFVDWHITDAKCTVVAQSTVYH